MKLIGVKPSQDESFINLLRFMPCNTSWLLQIDSIYNEVISTFFKVNQIKRYSKQGSLLPSVIQHLWIRLVFWVEEEARLLMCFEMLIYHQL